MSEYWKGFLDLNPHILQFEEIVEEILKNEPDWGIVCKLLIEIFEDLNRFIIALYCVEITKFCVALSVYSDDVAKWELPEKIRDFLLDDAVMLYLYPATFVSDLPEKLLDEARELGEIFKPIRFYRSRREIILKLTNESRSTKDISVELGIREPLVEKVMILTGHIKGKTPTHSLWVKYSMIKL